MEGLIQLRLLWALCCCLFADSFFSSSGHGCRNHWRLNTVEDGQGSVAEGIVALITRAGRPGPINVPRKRLELPFAVQLMRSSYNTIDELDVVAMDEFQKDFFKYRSYEWEDYRAKHPNILQGDLADSNYFDFISFAQYAVINDKIKNAKVEFVEKFNAEGDTRVVRREVTDALLVPTHSAKVGDIVLDYIIETYAQNGLVPKEVGKKKTLREFVEDAKMIVDIFTINGYCLESGIIDLQDGGSSGNGNGNSNSNSNSKKMILRLNMKLPANLWSFQVLKGMNAPLLNSFELKVLDAYARRSDVNMKVLSSSIKDTITLGHVLEISDGKNAPII